MGISTTRDYDVEREAVAAREYWARPETQPLSYKSPSHYAEAIATFIAATGVSSVLEFGCGGGRNLKQIRDVFAARGLSALALRGVDINESSIAWGKERYGLDLEKGDERDLSGAPEREYDLVFTVSVLDHLPDPAAALEALLKVTSRYAVFVEPCHGELEGTGNKVESISTEWQTTASTKPTAYTYFHDYHLLFGRHEDVEVVIDVALPTHLNKVGPFYRLFALRRKEPDSKDRAPEPSVDWLALREELLRRSVLTLLGGLDEAQRQLRQVMTEEVEPARSRLNSAMEKLNQAQAAVNEGQRTIGALTAELKQIRDKLAANEADNERLSNELRTERERSRRAIGSLQKQIAVIRDGATFRVGSAIVRCLKSPKYAVFLPWTLLRIGRDLRRRRSGGGVTATASAGAMDEALLDLYRKEGLEPVIERVEQYTGSNDPERRARELIRIGKVLSEYGFTSAELPLIRRAIFHHKSEASLRAWFWAAQRSGDYLDACGVVRQYEALVGRFPTMAQADFLDRARRSPAYLLSILELLEARAGVDTGSAAGRVRGRICYILHNSLPYSSGGYGTRSHGVAQGLASAGWDVVVLTRPGFPLDIKNDLRQKDLPEREEVEGITYIRNFAPLRNGTTALQYMTRSADVIESRLRELQPEFVVAASNHVTGLPALIAARRLGIPFAYEVRGLWEVTRMSREPDFAEKPAFAVQRILETAVAQGADHVFTLTEAMRSEMVERGVEAQKISLLPNSCDPERFIPRERDEALAERLGIPATAPVIGYIGTFVDYEGLENLAEACGILKRSGYDFRLLLVGNENASGTDRGPITAQITQIAASAGYSEWLVMPGRVPHEEVESYYSLIDIAPFPRKAWPVCEMVSPMKPLEALAMEKAVVVSSVRALAEMVIHEETGIIFEKGNVEDLARALGRLIDDRPLRLGLGRRGREWVKEGRTWRRVGEAASAVIKDLQNEGCPKPDKQEVSRLVEA